jgi:tRNA uracil 4-sulfurtransferase
MGADNCAEGYTMREVLMVRYGEIYLKGQNRPYFLKMLADRVKDSVKGLCGRVWLHDSRIFISDPVNPDEVISRVTRVFGVHSVCLAAEMEKNDFTALCAQAAQMMSGLSGTFKVQARRADKHYPLDSLQINAMMGEYILDHTNGFQVDVKNPDHVMSVEIRDLAYLYSRVVPGAGGMPVGTNGRAMALLSGGIDSPVAAYLIAKRGVQVSAIHFHSFPYTSDRAKEKVLDLARILSKSCCGIRVYVVPFTEIQMKIHELCAEEYTTLIMRRYMMRIAERAARLEGAQALITGESIGQVASQTMESLVCTDHVVGMPVFRPLIGLDKIEIIALARRIGTYDTSCLPYEDCCTVFTPRHPATHPKVDRIHAAERTLDEAALIDTAIAGMEIFEL